jgi:hypothetical protein
MSSMQWNIQFCFFTIIVRKNHLNVVLFHIGQFNKKNYVAT